MKRVEELGISPHPWIADGSFVSSEDGNVCLTVGNKIEIDDKERANSRLIAAAPDMYQVIIEAIPWLADISAEVVGNKCARQIDDLVKRMQVALAKASGEEAE